MLVLALLIELDESASEKIAFSNNIAFSPLHKIGVIVLTNCGIGQPVGEFGAWLMTFAVQSIRPSLAQTPSSEEGNGYYQRADWKNAAWAYDRITQREASNGAAFSRLGLAWSTLKKYDAAVVAFEKALALEFRRPQTMYNLACVSSLRGDLDQAGSWLERAVAAGFNNCAAVQTDPDLNNLRNDPRFKSRLFCRE